ncbi:hypothetical protein GY45DRAFT_1330832 [Cubamyces sp. BRFM 1775]|nr:hypothetical protein GY45DRAFT_1330832 [Cubamyces sp. BRFM 1775]
MLILRSQFLLLVFGAVPVALAAAAPQKFEARSLVERGSAPICYAPQVNGTIQVVDASYGGALGYVSQYPNSYGVYTITPDTYDAMNVALLRSCEVTNPFEIVASNGIAEFSYFGAVVGLDSTSDNIIPTSPNYVYIAGATSVPPGPAQYAPNAYTDITGNVEDVETAIWTLPNNPAADAPTALVPSWVNTDGSVASGASLVYVPGADSLALTGDVYDFSVMYGSDVQVVTFEFIPAALSTA